MCDLIVSVPDRCLSFYFWLSAQVSTRDSIISPRVDTKGDDQNPML